MLMAMKTISKTEAKRLGLKKFFTGLACRNSHIAERTVSRNDCVVCLAIRQRKWDQDNIVARCLKSKEWYENNTEQAKATRAKWRFENAEKDRTDVAIYQAAHKKELRDAAILWVKNNPEKVAEYQKEWRRRNRDAYLEASRRWASENKDKINAKKARRIAAKLQATPTWANLKAIREIYKLCTQITRETGVPHHVDHVVPLRSKWVCGLHCEINLQILPGFENQTKSNRHWPGMYAYKEAA